MRALLGFLLTLLTANAPAFAREQEEAPAAVLAAANAAPASFTERFQTPALDPRWIVSDRWHSGDWFSTEWRASQLGVGPQGAVFTLAPRADDGPKPYVSGEISTREAFLYGYFEARLRMPRGRGLVSAFFTYGRPAGIETRTEIDMELTGYDPSRIELVYHVGEQAHLQVVQLPFDASADFHTYAFEWRPDRIRWYIDNRLVHTSSGEQVGELNQPQRLFSSLWNSERMPRWLGVIEPAEAPWVMTVSCIAYAPRRAGRALCVD